MLVQELLTAKPLLEGKNLEVYEALLPLLLISEEDGGDGGESSPGDGGTPTDVPEIPPVTPPPVGSGWYRPGPFRPGGMGMNGNHWIGQLYSTLKNLAITTNIAKRMKELGIKGEGAKRIKLAQKIAAKHVKLLLSNPGATAYRIPVWTTQSPPKPIIKMWNEAFALEFQKQLVGIDLLSERVSATETRAMGQAAELLQVPVDRLKLVGTTEAENVIQKGKQLKRELIKAADAQWVVIFYTNENVKYVRVEAPDGNHKMFKA
jgi:hypothetical protein